MKNYLKQDYNNRRELFKKYYHWSLKTQDCDPAMFMMNYINKRMELNIEQRYWFAWLYGNTYNVATTWILFSEFPDFENVDMGRLTQWNADNYRQLRYQVDNKWQKGYLPQMFDSYRTAVMENHTNQVDYFNSICDQETPELNFEKLQKEIVKKWFKFGRYLSWFYLQTLRETCDLNINATSLLLKDSSSESHRNGLMYALGMDEIVEEKMKLDNDFYNTLNEEADLLLKEMQAEYPDVEAEYFSMETTLCAFKKIFRPKHSRYLGYYLDRQGEDITKCQADDWSGIDWNLLWQARAEIIDKRLLGNEVDKSRYGEILKTGTVQYLEWF